MKNACLYLFLLLLLSSLTSTAQKATKGRGLCQQEYIISAFMNPQFKKGPFQIKKTGDIDSLFGAMEAGWRKASADSLKKYPSELTLEEYGRLDAYCYFWALASMTQNLDIGSAYGKTLTDYMTAAMLKDEAILKRSATRYTIDLVHGGTLGNTLSIGSAPGVDKATFDKTFKVYIDFLQLFEDLSKKADTSVSHAANKQLKDIDAFFYPMYAGNAYFKGEYDNAFGYLITGLNVNRYGKSRAIDLTKKLLGSYNAAGDKDKSYTLLNALAINTTADNLDRNALRAMYVKIDADKGAKMYDNLQSKLSVSSFKVSDKQVKFPANWAFIANSIPAEKLQKAKYIFADFWYTGCGPCLAEIPELNALYDKLKQREDVIFISFNADYEHGKNSKVYVTKRSAELKVNFPVYYDEPMLAINKQMKVVGYPTKFIFTAKGEVVEKTDNSDMTLASFETFLKEQK